MWSKKAIFVLLVVTAIQQNLAARTWRPSGQAAIKGEFSDVVGTNVSIRTQDGINTVRYADLSPTDQAVVKSKLESMGRTNEAMQLDRGATGESGLPPFMGQSSSDATLPGEQGGNNRIWTDIAGNQLVAEFVGVQGPNVLLRAAGATKSFPIRSFSRTDQDWIAEHGGPGAEDPVAGGSASDMSPGHDQYPPSMPPRDPITMPPGMPPSRGEYPGGSMSGGHSAEGSYGSGATDSESYSAGSSQRSGSHWGPSPFAMEWEYRCGNCGATFPESSGLKSGDACPNCSRGASQHSRATTTNSGRSSSGRGGFFVGSIAIFTTIMAFVGWMVRQVFS